MLNSKLLSELFLMKSILGKGIAGYPGVMQQVIGQTSVGWLKPCFISENGGKQEKQYEGEGLEDKEKVTKQ